MCNNRAVTVSIVVHRRVVQVNDYYTCDLKQSIVMENSICE